MSDQTLAEEASAQPEEKNCRYCFEGEDAGELIAPCACSGGQRWVHLSCLRRWQRGILVSQPTHPNFYDDDLRHKICNVCKTEYTCRPPTRLELMESFVGAELAALVPKNIAAESMDSTSLIGSSRDFSAEMQRLVQMVPPRLRQCLPETNWINGIFLIVQMIQDTGGCLTLQISDRSDLLEFVSQLSSDWSWHCQGRTFRLRFDGPLQNVATADAATQRQAIISLQTPMVLRLETEGRDCGEDGVVAVNLTQPLDLFSPANQRKHARFTAAISKALPNGWIPWGSVSVTHFNGGPCKPDQADFAIVISATNEYRIHITLQDSLREAHRLDCLALAEQQESQPAVKRRRIVGKQSPNCLMHSRVNRQPVRLLVFWGTAGWSRCQLMSEIASGSWGLCKAVVEDVTVKKPQDLFESVFPRLAFAPQSQMSENYNSSRSAEDGEFARLVQLPSLGSLVRNATDVDGDENSESDSSDSEIDSSDSSSYSSDDEQGCDNEQVTFAGGRTRHV